jgi:MoaA/NifB/PqqE/SkfB family radical SAM enzyme
MYESIYIEISGHCNAKCPWCVTGRGAICEETKKFMSAREFSYIVDRLFSNKLINSNTTLMLYNWGEPFLNPELIDILKIICKRGCKYTLSTNASKYIQIPREVQQNLLEFTISMPGFSQDSYSKIHQFSFDKIIKNITKFIMDIDPQKITIGYHIYQFNIDEIDSAYSFFSKYGINMSPYYAYFNDCSLSQKFLKNNLPYDLLSNASKELVLGYVDKLISEGSPDYQCPEWNRLTIDEWGTIITCCVLPKNHPFYSLNLSLMNLPENICKEKIQEIIRNQPACKLCIESGIAYWAHNVQSPNFVKMYSKKFFVKRILARYIQKAKRLLCR